MDIILLIDFTDYSTQSCRISIQILQKKWLTKEAFCKSLACNDINGTCENLHIKRPTSTLYLLKIPSSLYSDLLQSINAYLTIQITRAVPRSENLGGHIVMGGDNVPPLVEIGLTDLPKSASRPPRL